MLRYIKLAFIILISITQYNCKCQSSDSSTNNLSQDFDKTPPFYYKMPNVLSAIDTSAAWHKNNQKIMITGTVYEIDGKTPVPNVIVYYYHTNARGIYATDTNEKRSMPKNALGQTHGHIRGWVKTNSFGSYSIYTAKPGIYPGRNEPAHIHISVKEKHLSNPYYLDDIVFDNDPILTTSKRNKMSNRGGSGVVRLAQGKDLWIGERNIILGLNIPDYPIQNSVDIISGKHIGEDLSSFTPYHAFGSDKDTKTCPICKYGWYHGILYFVGNKPIWSDIKKWLLFLEKESQQKGKYLKVYFIYGNDLKYNKNARMLTLESLGAELQLEKVSLTFVPSFSDKTSGIYLNKINQEAENTFIIYKKSNIIDKYINLKPNKDNFEKISLTLDASENAYFKLPKQKMK